MGDPETSPADMTGCWLRGFDTTPERHSRGGAEGWVDFLLSLQMNYIKMNE